ncbi:hypothetical protein M0805_003402 [Coniferiporia weirii]|nr:hypothetical protein M0805_003402 [Coniferiporia weirii]
MSDDFFSDEFDSAFLNEVDAIEAASQSAPRFTTLESAPKPAVQVVPTRPPQPQLQLRKDTSFSDFDLTFDVDPSELERLDEFIADSYAGKAQPVAGPSKLTRQTTLDGSTLPPPAQKTQSTRSFERTKSSTRTPLFGNRPLRTKQWDHTAFSKTGWLSTKGKTKGKPGADAINNEGMDEEFDDENVEFEQYPAPYTNGTLFTPMPFSPPPPMRLKPDLLAAKDWLFPLNRPRRDYQFNIAKNCLFQNTLVALPTGLGKTFIAGVVMLNYYRWFPEGKIIFVAPTRPLVAQQISACHEVCGIPGHDAAELTGSVNKMRRAAAWAEKRVLYMTPQTLRNDLSGGLADPLDIILLVIDEAHKGTGDYAYAQVVRYMMAKNPHFRVLALTATPGNAPETVQKIIDSLHISHIEIRNEQSYDLQKYIFKKEVKIHVIKMDEHVLKIRSLLCQLIDPLLKKVVQPGILHTQSPVMLHTFSCQTAQKDLHKRNEKGIFWAYGVLKVLGILSRAMACLMECSSRMCFEVLKSLKTTLNESEKVGDKRMRDVLKNPNYIKLMEECERQQAYGFAPHPKMDKLVSLVLSHFANAQVEGIAETPEASSSTNTTTPSSADSKIMIFVHFRDCVDEIMSLLNRHKPMLRASQFIGQGVDKKGRKGLGQNDQLEIIQKFKTGEYNILVSTSVGEEGLDIGEIDRIVCYDAQKSSVRMLQRVGRTGRKRMGYVDVLLAEEREERNWDKSKENYTDVQDTIIKGNQLELYGDVERLLPDNIQPQCLQTTMKIEEYSRPTNDSPVKGKKRKRNVDINRNVPLGALTGFVTASELRPKAKKVKKAKTAALHETDLEEDSDDAEIARGLRSSTSTTKRARAKMPVKGKGSKATFNKPARAQSSLKNYLADPVPERLEDDDDDLDIRIGLTQFKAGTNKEEELSSDSSDSGVRPIRNKLRRRKTTPSSLSPGRIPASAARNHTPLAETTTLIPGSALSTSLQPRNDIRNEWLLELAESSDVEILPPSPRTEAKKLKSSNDGSHFQSAKIHMRQIHSSLPQPEANASAIAFLPPLVDDRLSPLLDEDTNGDDPPALPNPTFAVRMPVRRKVVHPQASLSSPTEERTDAPRRIVRRQSSVLMGPPPDPPMARVKSTKKPKLKMTSNPLLFDVEAAHSGDDVSEGGSDIDMVESDSDRRFLEELQETQASPSYNQSAAYRMGLMTQVSHDVNGPRFVTKPKRTGAFAGGRTQIPRPADWSSSPVRNSEPDEYHMGSFVVNDDDSILYDISSEA